MIPFFLSDLSRIVELTLRIPFQGLVVLVFPSHRFTLLPSTRLLNDSMDAVFAFDSSIVGSPPVPSNVFEKFGTCGNLEDGGPRLERGLD